MATTGQGEEGTQMWDQTMHEVANWCLETNPIRTHKSFLESAVSDTANEKF